MRAVAAAAMLASLAAATAASAEQAPIPLKAPTGYRDFCDGLARSPTTRDGLRLCPRGGVPQALWRPLALPAVDAGSACPATPSRKIARFLMGLGAGPVYPSRTFPVRTRYPAPENSLAAGSGWAVDKVPLLLKKTFHGPFVVRGRRVDGEGLLGFSGIAGRRPFEAMQFAPGRATLKAGGLLGWGIGVWMTSPGCYALQIDGPTFSRVVVFRVEFT
jgi:hypothetical protein